MVKQSNIVWVIGHQPDELEIRNNQLIHHRRVSIGPNSVDTYPLNDLRRSIKFQWDVLILWPIWALIRAILGFSKTPTWRKIILTESQTGKKIRVIKFIENWNELSK